METKISKVNFSKQTKYLENGMEYDDFSELVNFNHELTDIYSV
jgi:hypothetical protein